MAVFTVHVPPGATNATRRADGTIFVKEGFSLPAFLFGPLFLVYRRLWLATLGWCVLALLLGALAQVLHLPAPAQAAMFFLLALLTGLEASTFRQGALGRRGYIFAALLACPTREHAERAFFQGEGLRVPPHRPAPGSKTADTDVIGLFPSAGELA